MGEAHFRTPLLRNRSTDFDVMSNILLRPPQRVDVQNLVGISLAVTDLRMREKTRFVWIFLLTYLSIYLCIYLSVRYFVGATGHSFGPFFTLNGSNDVVSQPLVPFLWSH